MYHISNILRYAAENNTPALYLQTHHVLYFRDYINAPICCGWFLFRKLVAWRNMICPLCFSQHLIHVRNDHHTPPFVLFKTILKITAFVYNIKISVPVIADVPFSASPSVYDGFSYVLLNTSAVKLGFITITSPSPSALNETQLYQVTAAPTRHALHGCNIIMSAVSTSLRDVRRSMPAKDY